MSKGQDIKLFKVEAFVEEGSMDGRIRGHWQELHDIISEEPARCMTTIGRKRILCFPNIRTRQIRVTIIERKSNFRDCRKLKSLSAYLAPEI